MAGYPFVRRIFLGEVGMVHAPVTCRQFNIKAAHSMAWGLLTWMSPLRPCRCGITMLYVLALWLALHA